MGGGGYQPGATPVVGAGACTAGLADLFDVASSDQALSAAIPISATVTSAEKDDNLYMTSSRLVY